jgi:hypothetical protein
MAWLPVHTYVGHGMIHGVVANSYPGKTGHLLLVHSHVGHSIVHTQVSLGMVYGMVDNSYQGRAWHGSYPR